MLTFFASQHEFICTNKITITAIFNHINLLFYLFFVHLFTLFISTWIKNLINSHILPQNRMIFHITVCVFAKCKRHLGESSELQTRCYMKFGLAVNSFSLTFLKNYLPKFMWFHSVNIKFKNIFVCYSYLVFYSSSMLRTIVFIFLNFFA